MLFKVIDGVVYTQDEQAPKGECTGCVAYVDEDVCASTIHVDHAAVIAEKKKLCSSLCIKDIPISKWTRTTLKIVEDNGKQLGYVPVDWLGVGFHETRARIVVTINNTKYTFERKDVEYLRSNLNDIEYSEET